MNVAAEYAAEILADIDRHWPDPIGHDTARAMRDVLALASEVGEFVGAYCRWAGLSRRSDEWSAVQQELADVVITANVVAARLRINVDDAVREKGAVILARGWRTD